jgi:hypothetical protein
MASIVPCSSALGRVSVYTTSAPAPVVVTFDYPTQLTSGGAISWTPNPQPLRTIGLATGLRLGQEVAAQFQPAFDATVYVTPFGDMPGIVEIDFLANKSCEESADGLDIIEHYLRMRLLPTEITTFPTLAVKHTPRQTITVGRSAFTGYVTKLDYTAQTQDAVSIGAKLTMRAWPV